MTAAADEEHETLRTLASSSLRIVLPLSSAKTVSIELINLRDIPWPSTSRDIGALDVCPLWTVKQIRAAIFQRAKHADCRILRKTKPYTVKAALETPNCRPTLDHPVKKAHAIAYVYDSSRLSREWSHGDVAGSQGGRTFVELRETNLRTIYSLILQGVGKFAVFAFLWSPRWDYFYRDAEFVRAHERADSILREQLVQEDESSGHSTIFGSVGGSITGSSGDGGGPICFVCGHRERVCKGHCRRAGSGDS